jgi:hypothetical protein
MILSVSKSAIWPGINKKIRKIFRWIIFLFIIFLAIFVYWKYYFTYSEGYRAGLLQKFSRKGTVFKTYEGEMILSSVLGSRDVTIASEKFFFSVIDKSLAPQFDTLQGSIVVVHYRQKNKAVFWRGDSPYLVDSVKLKK